MKFPGRCRKRKAGTVSAILMMAAVVMVVGLVPAWAAGGGQTEQSGHAADADHAAGDGHHEVHSKPWLLTDTAKVLNFAVLAIVLFLVLRKPASQALNGRIKGIADELEDLEARKAEVEKQLAQYDQKLADLDKESEQIIAEYIRQGEDAKARILREAAATADKLEDQAKKNIEHEFKQAKLTLQTEIVEKALAKAEQAIKNQVTDQDQDRLVDEYLDKVVA
jgi:F-type H+-transporting ATPase subunit b